jgi:hypothetical protein
MYANVIRKEWEGLLNMAEEREVRELRETSELRKDIRDLRERNERKDIRESIRHCSSKF